ARNERTRCSAGGVSATVRIPEWLFVYVTRRSLVAMVCAPIVGGDADIDHYRGLTPRPQPPTVGRVSTPRERLDHTMADHTATAAPTARHALPEPGERRRAETDHATTARERPLVRVDPSRGVRPVARSRAGDAGCAAALRRAAARRA